MELKKGKDTSPGRPAFLDSPESILSAMPDMMFLLTGEGFIVDFNARSGEDLYHPPDVIAGSNIQETMPPAFVRKCMHAINRVLDTGRLHCFEYQLPLPDGMK